MGHSNWTFVALLSACTGGRAGITVGYLGHHVMLKLERYYAFPAAHFTFDIALSCGNVPIRTIGSIPVREPRVPAPARSGGRAAGPAVGLDAASGPRRSDGSAHSTPAGPAGTAPPEGVRSARSS